MIQKADVFHSAGILILNMSANYLLMATLHSASVGKLPSDSDEKCKQMISTEFDIDLEFGYF